MNLDKKTVRKIMLIIVFAVLFTAVIINIGEVWSALGSVVRVLSPVLVGLSIGFIINVPMRAIENKLFAPLNKRLGARWARIRRPIAILLSILVIFGLLALLLNMIIPQLMRAVEMLARELPGWVKSVSKWAAPYLAMLGIKADSGTPLIDWTKISGLISDFLKNASSVLGTTVNVTSQVFGAVSSIVLGVIFAIYFLMGKEKLGRQAKRFLYAAMKTDAAHTVMRLCTMAHNAFSNFFTGQCTEAVIVGILCFVGLNLFGFPNATMIAALVGASALIPIFGAFLGAAAGALIMLMDSGITALWFLLFIIVLQQLEGNLIYPRVVGNAVGLPGIWVLAAVTVGGNISGIIGMLVSVPICSVLYALIREYVWDKLTVKRDSARDSGDADTEQSIAEVMMGETPKDAVSKKKRSLLRSIADRWRAGRDRAETQSSENSGGAVDKGGDIPGGSQDEDGDE